MRINADVQRACRVLRTVPNPEPSQQAHSIGAIIPILQMEKLRPGGDHFLKVTQSQTSNLVLTEAGVHASNCQAPCLFSIRDLAQAAFGNCKMLLKNT